MAQADGVPELLDGNISMSANHFRWLLMVHGAFVRHAMTIEVEWFGLERARQNTDELDRQRRLFVERLQEEQT